MDTALSIAQSLREEGNEFFKRDKLDLAR